MSDTTTQIVITPLKDDGILVEIDGDEIGRFASGGQAAAHFALAHLEMVRLRKIINDHAAFLYTRTPDQARKLDAATVRGMAEDLLSSAKISQ